MSEKKNKMGLIIAVAAVIAVAGGAMSYFSKNTTTDNFQDIATAAGDSASEKAENKSPDVNTGSVVEPGNPIVARVDGKEISRLDVYRFIKTMPPQMQQMPASSVYPLALEQVINTRIVQNKANDAKIAESDEAKFQMEMARQQIIRNVYLQKQVDTKITKKMLKKAYKEYSAKIPEVEERRARHILVETEDKAKAVVKKLKTGEKFEDLAKSLSIGPTGARGGDLGYFAKNEMVPAFAEAAFSMKKDSTLETPVKTRFGWHVIQLIDIRKREAASLEEMTPVLKAELSRTALEDLMQGWRKKAEIEQFDINGKPLNEVPSKKKGK